MKLYKIELWTGYLGKTPKSQSNLSPTFGISKFDLFLVLGNKNRICQKRK